SFTRNHQCFWHTRPIARKLLTPSKFAIIVVRQSRTMSPNAALKDAIFRSGKSQLFIARKVKIHETRLSKIVRGWVEPTHDEREVLAKALRVAEDEIFPVSRTA